MQTNNYSRQQVEEMLADYVFGKLTDAERAEFERAVQAYPELVREVEDVRSVFSRVEKMDINSMIDQHTRNLSVKVNKRMATAGKRNGRTMFMRWAIPAVIGATALVVMLNISPKPQQLDGSIEEEIAAMINKDVDKLPLNEMNEVAMPSAFLPQIAPIQTSSQAVGSTDNDVLDDLLAESVTVAAGQQEDSDFMETERMHLQNTIDINDVEQMIKELDDTAS